jgi:hypothetical protein
MGSSSSTINLKGTNNLCVSARRKVQREVKKWRKLFYEDYEAPRERGKKEERKGDEGNLPDSPKWTFEIQQILLGPLVLHKR